MTLEQAIERNRKRQAKKQADYEALKAKRFADAESEWAKQDIQSITAFARGTIDLLQMGMSVPAIQALVEQVEKARQEVRATEK